MIPSRIWRGLTAVAFAALVVLVLQPVCAAAESVAQQSAGEPCCMSMDEAPTISAASPEPHWAKMPPVVAPPQLTWQPRVFSERWRALVDSAPPPRGLSYHARSARLLL